MATPEGEPEPEAEPEYGTNAGEASAEGRSYANGTLPWYMMPDPNWERFHQQLPVALPLHTYFTGIMFLLIALVSFGHLIILLRMRSKSQGKPYYLTLHSLMIVGGTTRGIHFLADPYNSRSIFPAVLASVTMNLFDPCVLSAFILVFTALIRVTRLRLVSGGLFKPAYITGLIILSFTIELAADIIVVALKASAIYGFICRLYFIFWGLGSSIFYVYLFCRIYNRIFMTRVKINRMSRSRTKNPSKNKNGDIKIEDTNAKQLDNLKCPQSPGLPGENIPFNLTDDGQETPRIVIVSDVTTRVKPDYELEMKLESSPDSELGNDKHNQEANRDEYVTQKYTATKEPPVAAPLSRRDKAATASPRPQKTDGNIVDASVPLIAKLVLLAAGVFLLLSCVSAFSVLMACFHICEDEDGKLEAWCWWMYQMTMRLLEICMAAVISAIGALPLYRRKKV